MENFKNVNYGKKSVRRSYSKIRTDVDLPGLIDIQTKSFDQFVESGLQEVFDDFSPIVSFNGELKLYFQDYHLAKEKETYVIIDYDFTKIDKRFTNNPLFYEKSEDKPYLESNAYNDYLTYQMVFDSIKSVVDYFFVIILFYSIICSILLNVSIMKKDIKQIAIFISRGHDSFQILLSYQIPLIIYLIIASISLLFTFDLLVSIIIAYLLQFITIIISYFYIKSKPLHNLLKEDTLC